MSCAGAELIQSTDCNDRRDIFLSANVDRVSDSGELSESTHPKSDTRHEIRISARGARQIETFHIGRGLLRRASSKAFVAFSVGQ